MFLQVSPNVPMWVGVQGVVSGLVRETGGSDRAPPPVPVPPLHVTRTCSKRKPFLNSYLQVKKQKNFEA